MLARDFAPVISPSGRQIAFVRYQGDRADLWTMGVDGRHQRRVLRGLVLGLTGRQNYLLYAWSSDSRRLAVLLGPKTPAHGWRHRFRGCMAGWRGLPPERP